MPTHFLAYGTLRLASQAIWRDEAQRQVKVFYGIFCMLVLQAIEIVLFGVAFWLLVVWPVCGSTGLVSSRPDPAPRRRGGACRFWRAS